MRFFGFLALLMCAEWLLIFRIWASFRFLLLFVASCYVRAHILRFIPHWDAYYLIFPVATLAMLYHLRCAWRGRSARYRDFYNTPDSGVPWLVIVAQTPKAALFLEQLLMMAFLVYMASYGAIVYPLAFSAFPPAWEVWLSTPANAGLFCVAYALSAMFGLSLWNLSTSGAPLWKPKASNADAYPYVREASHTPPRLPSVKELADDLQQF